MADGTIFVAEMQNILFNEEGNDIEVAQTDFDSSVMKTPLIFVVFVCEVMTACHIASINWPSVYSTVSLRGSV